MSYWYFLFIFSCYVRQELIWEEFETISDYKTVSVPQSRAKNSWSRGIMSNFWGVALILCYVMLCCLIFCAKSDALNEQNLMLCYAVLWFVMLTYFMSKILFSQWVKSYALLCCVMICYADLFYEQNPMLSISKILLVLLDLMKLTVL